MNKIFLLGNVSREVEVRTTQNGVKVANFGIAVNRRFTNAQGNREADFFTVIAWRGLAEFAEKYVEKGKKLLIIGSVQNRQYDTQDGQKKNVTEIIAEEIEFAGTKTDEKKTEGRAEQEKPKQPELTEVEDYDLPF